MANSQSGNDTAAKEGKPPAKKEKTVVQKIALWSACVLWVLSIVLSFAIPTSSSLIWLPDTVLLLGFFPLIIICRYSIIWLAFGILTGFIGSFLLVLTNIPDSALPAQTISVKKHLAEYHPCWSWMILGTFVTVCGTIRLLVNSVFFFVRRGRNQGPGNSPQV